MVSIAGWGIYDCHGSYVVAEPGVVVLLSWG